MPTGSGMLPTTRAEPQTWAPASSFTTTSTTGTTGRPTTGRLDTGSTLGTEPTGIASGTVAVRPTSGIVRVLVWLTSRVVRVPLYEYLHKDPRAGHHEGIGTVPVPRSQQTREQSALPEESPP